MRGQHKFAGGFLVEQKPIPGPIRNPGAGSVDDPKGRWHANKTIAALELRVIKCGVKGIPNSPVVGELTIVNINAHTDGELKVNLTLLNSGTRRSGKDSSCKFDDVSWTTAGNKNRKHCATVSSHYVGFAKLGRQNFFKNV